jgi:hypothetical protein
MGLIIILVELLISRIVDYDRVGFKNILRVLNATGITRHNDEYDGDEQDAQSNLGFLVELISHGSPQVLVVIVLLRNISARKEGFQNRDSKMTT